MVAKFLAAVVRLAWCKAACTDYLGGPIGANGLQKTFRTALRVLTAAEICAHRVLKQLGQARCACHGFQATMTVLVFDCPIISSRKYLYNSIAKETNQIPA